MPDKKKRVDRHAPGYNQRFLKENYDSIHLKIRKDSGIKQAVAYVAEQKRTTITEYIVEAILQQLAIDGYIPGEELPLKIDTHF